MKYIIIFLITVYQYTLSPLIRSIFGSKLCRYEESCSRYAKRVISQYGMIKGVPLSILRLLSCQPFGRIQR